MKRSKASGPALTPDQRAALDVLTERRRRFVLAFIGEAAGNATEAARIAGYAHPDPEGARLLGTDRVRAAVEAMRAPAERASIATIEELRAMWSEWARSGAMEATIDGERVSTPLEPRDRMKASELLGKSLGGFLERRELSGPGGGPLEGVIRPRVVFEDPAHAAELAREASETTSTKGDRDR